MGNAGVSPIFTHFLRVFMLFFLMSCIVTNNVIARKKMMMDYVPDYNTIRVNNSKSYQTQQLIMFDKYAYEYNEKKERHGLHLNFSFANL